MCRFCNLQKGEKVLVKQEVKYVTDHRGYVLDNPRVTIFIARGVSGQYRIESTYDKIGDVLLSAVTNIDYCPNCGKKLDHNN